MSDTAETIFKIGGAAIVLKRLSNLDTGGDPGTDEHIAALPNPKDGTVTFEASAESSETVSWTVTGNGDTFTFTGNPAGEEIPFGATYTVTAEITGGETERTYQTTLDLTGF